MICRRRVCIPDGSVWGTSRSGGAYSRVTDPAYAGVGGVTLRTRGAKGMHTRPCGNQTNRIIGSNVRLGTEMPVDNFAPPRLWLPCVVANSFSNESARNSAGLFPRSFAGRSIRPTRSPFQGRASSRRKAQEGNNTDNRASNSNEKKSDSCGGETLTKENT